MRFKKLLPELPLPATMPAKKIIRKCFLIVVLSAFQPALQSVFAAPITVRALGTNGDEQLQLILNGSVVQTWTLTTSFADYTYQASVASGDVRVNFSNDFGTRDVRIDYIQAHGVTHQAEAQATNTGVWQNGGCGGSYSEWLNCGGYIGFGTITISAGSYTPISVVARAGGGGTVGTLQLRINNATVQSWTLSSSYQTFTYTPTVGSGNVRVFWTDDAVDAECDYIIAGTTVYQAEDQSSNTAVWQNGGCGGSYSQQMQCSGYIDFGTLSFGGGSGDTQAPSVPANLTTSNVNQTSFSLSWTASTDNVGVTGYEVFRNGTSVGTTTSTSITVSGLACNTAYSVTVRARDAAGNWSAQSSAKSQITSACSSGKKTLIGINPGNDPAFVSQYESWLGKPLDAIVLHDGHASWSDWDISWDIGNMSGVNRQKIWTIPGWADGGNWSDAASGNYNSYYLTMAQALNNAFPNDSVIYIRYAYEWNGGWFPWGITSQSQCANFINGWRQFVNTFRSVSNRFRFDWCASVFTVNFGYENAYPGDAYVDYIGLDIYDDNFYNPVTSPQENWNKCLTYQGYGLNWFADFAAAHNKSIAIAEWGTGDLNSGDDTYFVQQMYNWITSHNVVYACYWESTYAYNALLSDGTPAQASALYKQLFGSLPSALAVAKKMPVMQISSEQKLKVYPNPVKAGSNITITGLDIEKSMLVELYTVSGVKVAAKLIDSGNGTLSTNNLKPGLYLVKIKSDKLSLFSKIIVD